MAHNQYVMPAYGGSNATLAGYLREACSQGEAWLSTQKPAASYPNLIEKLDGPLPGADLLGQSNAQYEKVDRLYREIVASLTSFSHVGEVKPVTNKQLFAQSNVLTKIDHAWFHLAQTYDALRTLTQLAVALGTGYGWQVWDPHFYGEYKGDVRLVALPPSNVTFVQLPGDHDIQRAYIVLIREELPITLAKRIYRRTNPAFAEALLPDRDAPGWVAKGLRKVQQFLSPALRVRGMRPGETDQDTSFPTVDIYHAYTLDDTVNTTGAPMTMGAKGTNWEYTVPSLGDAMLTPLMNPATGQPFTRPADHADARLFPLRRYTIFSRSTDIVAYDGSSPWWHGMAPLVRLRFNDKPWQALGRSCVGMAISLEESATAIMQGIEDSIAVGLDPALLYNDQAVSKTFVEAFNPRKAGARAAVDLTQGDVLKPALPARFYEVPSYMPEYLKWLDDRMEYLTGARDLTAIAKAKQIPSSDGMEKLLEMAGPLVQDMVHALILPLEQMGTMRISDYCQFMTYDRILQGASDVGEMEDWAFTPDLLVNTIPGETLQSRRDRTKKLVGEFKYRVTQSGITEINRMVTKLFYTQLMKAGFPLDWWTFAKVAQLPNFGPEPEGTHTILEKFVAQTHVQHDLAEEVGGGPPAPQGRPPSGHAAPHIVQKSGGRSTTAQSR